MKEVEKKFLVKDGSWRREARGSLYRQGYLCALKERVVRVRTFDGRGFLTIKGVTRGITRVEYEYEIPVREANEMLEHLCKKPVVEKKRYRIEYEGHVWEVDEFLSENQGLVLAEVELEREDEEIKFPPWVGEEVSGDPRYYNINLVDNPYKNWNESKTEKERG
ncbi:MAG: CYTH domain-containing protein [Deltaproteobacteria bacterium]|nr:CYTH domain-containing protein [Deltaproteobacteria bacterium]MBW2298937.1 CYTH domain-containing protein [Deltaproteobacteria bacterium]RLB30204.1 MAG: adenylate cyclase [Deltaproteobacteria bacterium]